MEIKLLGIKSKKGLEERTKIIAASGKLSRFPGSVFDSLNSCDEYEKNKRLVERIIKMGHESITEHDYLVFALKDVSPVIEQILIKERIASFTVKSRREVDFSKVGYYVPNFRNNNYEVVQNNKELQKKYCNHMESLFNDYAYFIDNGVNKEDSRFVLPYSYHSNFIMGCDARVLKNIIIRLTKGKESKISEVKELGNILYEIVKKHVPYLVSSIELAKVDSSIENYLKEKSIKPNYNILEKVSLLSYTKDVDQTIIISSLMRIYQVDEKEARRMLNKLTKEDSNFISGYIKAINNDFEKLDFTQVNFRFQIPISFAVLTHLTRHRTHDLLIPDFVPVNNLDYYKTPASIKKFNDQYFNNVFKKNKEIYEYFKKQGICDEDLIYFHLSGHMVNVVTNMNGKTLGWITRLRRCTKAQWEIRNISDQLYKLVSEKSEYFSKILGPDCEVKCFCSEGKESCGKIDLIVKKVNKEKVCA